MRHRVLVIGAMLAVSFLECDASQKIADQKNLIFDRISTENGLSQGIVTAMAQDTEGFMWVGTQEGLNRYDGFRFENYYHREDNSESLSHDYVRSIFFDSQGRMWVATDGGLDQYNPNSRHFLHIDIGQVGDEKIVYSLLEDTKSNLWIGTSEGLAVLLPDQSIRWFRNLSIFSGDDAIVVRSLLQDKEGNLWVGTERHGLLVGGIERGFNLAIESLGSSNVRDIVEDRYGNIWVSTFNDGALKYDPTAETWVRYTAGNGPGDLRSNRIRSLLEDHEGNIWFGTDRGLHLLTSDNQFLRFEHDLSNPRSISDNTVQKLYQDKGGVVWVGTFNGISKWNAKIEMFPYFRRPISESSDAQSNNITSFVSTESGDVWIGTFSGLMLWDSQRASLRSLDPVSMGLIDSRVMSLGRNGTDIWAGTVTSGVNVISGKEVKYVLQHNRDSDDSISSNAITRIFKDSNERTWVATYGAGVNLYLGDGKFKRFPGNNPALEFPDLRCMDIAEAADGRLWIATQGGGVVILDPESPTVEILQHKPNDQSSIPSNEVLSLLPTETGMWMGTVNRGLSYYEYSTGKVFRYSKRDGLASDSVYGLLTDNQGMIWASGGKGLSMMNPATGAFTIYDSSHGLQSSDFNSGAYAKFSDGSLVFGGNNGFNAFYPERIKRNSYIPPVHITGFNLFNEKVNFDQPLGSLTEITLDHNDTVLGFEFAALDFTAPKKNQYRYKLEGFDRDWVSHQGNREVTYTNLDAGNYVFRVQGSNNDGVWNTEGAAISLKVNPAPWLTWWAYALYTIVTLLAMYMLLRLNLNRLAREAERRYSERLQLYIESLEEATDSILIADSSGSLMFANKTITEELNRSAEEVLGKPFWDVLFETSDDIESAKAALASDGRYHGEVDFSSSAGRPVTHEVTIAAVQQASRSERAYVGISRDVTERKITEAQLEDYRKNLEKLVEERTAALQKEIAENKAIQVHLAESLQEKELLLKEVHHRVKNNMQVISSLLSIQAEGAGDALYSTLLNESQQRIKSMALIHETLYQSADLLKIDFQEYIESLTGSLSRSYSIPGVTVRVEVNVEDVSLDLDTAVPCGLIINELVSNSLKHAFSGKEGLGLIKIDFRTSDCDYSLRIADNGIGLPADFDPTKNVSMGMEIVSILTTQLEGELQTSNCDGAVFEITFPRSAHA